MTILPADDAPTALGGAQISYRSREKNPDRNSFQGAQISYSLPESVESKTRSRRLSSRTDESINRWMIRKGFDYIEAHYLRFKKMPSDEDVTSHLFTVGCDKLQPVSGYERFHSGMRKATAITDDEVERWARSAAEFALSEFDPEYRQKRQAWGAKGGRTSKRKPLYTWADFLKVERLSHAEAAQVLGVSVSTVRRMRADFRRPAIPEVDIEPLRTPALPRLRLDELVNTL